MYKVLKKKAGLYAATGFVICFILILVVPMILRVNLLKAIPTLGFAKNIAVDHKLADYEGKFVKYTVKYPLEIYSSTTEHNKMDNVSFIVWDAERNDYLAVVLNANLGDRTKKMIDQTWTYFTEENAADVQDSFVVKGIVKKMNADDLDAYKKTMNTMFGDLASDQVIDMWYIDTSTYNKMGMTKTYFAVFCSGFFALFGLFLLFVGLSPLYRMPLKRFFMTCKNVSQEQFENDFATAAQFGCLWIGKQYSVVFNTKGMADALANNSLIWVFVKNEDLNLPIKTIHIFTKEKKHYKVRIAKSDAAKAMSYIRSEYPLVMTKYSKELASLYKKDFNRFLYKSGLR